MSAGHTVTVTPSDARVEVRLGGELLAETDRAVRLEETGLPGALLPTQGRRAHGSATSNIVPHHVPIQG